MASVHPVQHGIILPLYGFNTNSATLIEMKPLIIPFFRTGVGVRDAIASKKRCCTFLPGIAGWTRGKLPPAVARHAAKDVQTLHTEVHAA